MKTAVCFPPLLLGFIVCCAGCLVAPKSQLLDCQTQNRVLAEQNRAQLAEIDNLKVHCNLTEDKLARAEEDLALLEQRVGMDKTRLAVYQQEHSALNDQVQDLLGGGLRTKLPQRVSKQLADLSRSFPGMRFDPDLGVAKLDADVLFDNGQVEPKPGAKEMARELVGALKSPEAGNLKVMVVGHTDDRPADGQPAGDAISNNLHLSAARAVAVADLMREAGLPEKRLGVAGLASHEPVAPNTSERDRQKNRRVEIFIMSPDVPVVGWTDTMPSLY
jgi:chemotaxis protein MotB